MSSEWIEKARLRTFINPETGCWEYNGNDISNGYGRIWCGGKNVRIHRLSFQAFNGEIPKEIMVCHRCDVRNCWNPEHLFLGTAKDNFHDMINKGRRSRVANPPKDFTHILRGEKAVNSKLTTQQVLEIREMHSSGKAGKRRLAASFGVSRTAIELIIKRRRWVHI